MAISALFNLCFSQYGIYLHRTPQGWRWRYREYPGFFPEGILQQYEGGRLVGTVLVTERPFQVGEQVYRAAMIDDVATHPDHRGRGIARRLEERAIELAKQRGADLLQAYTGVGAVNDRLLQELGFRPLAKIHHLVRVIDWPRLIFNYGFDLLALWRLERRKSVRRPPLGPVRARHGEGAFEPFSHSNLGEVMAVLNEAGRHDVGFTPYTRGYLSWKLLRKPGFRRRHVLCFRTRRRLNVCLLSFHRQRLTRSGKEFLLARLDDLACESFAVGRSLVRRAELLARAEGACTLLCVVDARDRAKYALLASSGFTPQGHGHGLILSLKKTDLPPNRPHYVAAESCVGEP